MEVAVEVQPQEVAGVVGWAAGLGGHRPLKAERAEIELRHEGVEEADGIVRSDVVVHDFRQEDGLAAISAGEVGHGRSSKQGER